jgi:DNA-directed RNA polymerase subunit omega
MDEAKIDRLARKVGGRFRLASLVSKRLIEINRGSQLLVEPESDNVLYNVLDEVDHDLIRLVPRLPAPEEGDEGGEIAQED